MPTTLPSPTYVAQNASRHAIVAALGQLADTPWRQGRWLDAYNRYARDTVTRIKADNGHPRAGQFSQYMAASVILHCSDGWSFLSRAVNSLMDGDASTAIHLAYYAELRAAMSFLASEGIAVLKNEHYWFDSAGKCHPMQKLGTHDIVWKLLTAWADEPSRSARLLQLFVVNGENFGAWLQAAGYSPGSPTTTELAKDWLKTWSLDLQTLPDDRTLRNEVSYRPQRLIHAVPRSNFVVMLRIIMSYWQATEPTASARFEQLDLFLLRYTLERAYRGRTGQRPRGGPYERFIETTLSALGMSPSSAIVDFLGRRQATRNHPLLGEARKKGQKSNGCVSSALKVSSGGERRQGVGARF